MYQSSATYAFNCEDVQSGDIQLPVSDPRTPIDNFKPQLYADLDKLMSQEKEF